MSEKAKFVVDDGRVWLLVSPSCSSQRKGKVCLRKEMNGGRRFAYAHARLRCASMTAPQWWEGWGDVVAPEVSDESRASKGAGQDDGEGRAVRRRK